MAFATELQALQIIKQDLSFKDIYIIHVNLIKLLSLIVSFSVMFCNDKNNNFPTTLIESTMSTEMQRNQRELLISFLFSTNLWIYRTGFNNWEFDKFSILFRYIYRK